MSEEWNQWTIPSVIVRILIAPTTGHGLMSTIWKMWLDLIVIRDFCSV